MIRPSWLKSASVSSRSTGPEGISCTIDPTELYDNLFKLYDQTLRVLPEAAVAQIGFPIMNLSDSICPIDTGTLVNTHFVSWEGAGEEARVSIGYDGQGVNPKTGKLASTYAVEVHEDLSVYHKSGSAKFLETALYSFADEAYFAQAYWDALNQAAPILDKDSYLNIK